MQVRTLRGFRDYLPAEMLAKEDLLKRVRNVFESFGYPPLQTPALEYAELLAGKYGGEGEMLMYRFRDQGNRDVCLRYDLTVPLARVVAEHTELPLPFRRYQIAPVWRAEKPARGRYREFMQCDVDLVGADDAAADAEMLLINAEVLRALEMGRFEVRVNHRAILTGLIRSFGVGEGAEESAFLRLLDKLPKIGAERFLATMERDFGFDTVRQKALLDGVEPKSDPGQTLAKLAAIVAGDPVGASGVERLTQVLDLVTAAGFREHTVVDPRIARGLAYYDGMINETFLVSLPELGSVMSGGRYNKLVGQLSGRELPAVGNSLGIDRLFDAKSGLTKGKAPSSPARVLVVRFGEEGADSTFAIATRLRAHGIPTVVYPAPVKLRKQFQYAHQLAIPFVVLQGEDEASRGTVTLKNMDSGEQQELTLEGLLAQVAGAVE